MIRHKHISRNCYTSLVQVFCPFRKIVIHIWRFKKWKPFKTSYGNKIKSICKCMLRFCGHIINLFIYWIVPGNLRVLCEWLGGGETISNNSSRLLNPCVGFLKKRWTFIKIVLLWKFPERRYYYFNPWDFLFCLNHRL